MARRVPVVLLAVLLLVGAACSDGGKKEPVTQPSTSTTELSEVPTTFTGGDKTKFCAAFVEMERPKNKHLAGSTADDIRAYYRRRAAFLRRIRAASSTEIRASVVNHLWFNNRIVRSGKLTDLVDSSMVENTKIVYGYAQQQCGLPTPSTTTSTSSP